MGSSLYMLDMEWMQNWKLTLTGAKFLSAIILLIFSSVKAEIRCYCNQPACVSTGYMCKSAVGLCFTEYTGGLHGCLQVRKKRCSSALRCCQEDMCNYADAMDINIQVHTNHSPLSGPFSGSEAEIEAALRRGIWFKAAVIAVPIAGICILILLVMAAARMLKQDTRRQKHLLELRRQHQLHHQLYRNVALAPHYLQISGGHSLKDTLLPMSKCKNTTIV